MRCFILSMVLLAGVTGSQVVAQSADRTPGRLPERPSATTTAPVPVGPFRISPAGCVDSGKPLTVSGRFTPDPSGEIVLSRGGAALKPGIIDWSARRVVLRLPKGGRFQADVPYELNWNISARQSVDLGRVTFCAPEQAVRPGKPSRPAARDEVPTPGGAPEYIVTAPTGQAGAIATALQNQGADLLRTRSLNALGLRLMVFDFPPSLSLPQARQIVGGISGDASVDVHHIYGVAAAPRLYSAAALGEPEGAFCSLRKPVRVGVIDGPVNANVPALQAVRLVQVDVFENGEKHIPADHGTAVAGLIAAPAGAGALQGVASGAQIYSAPAFSKERSGQGARLENVAAALNWLAGQKVQLVNMSFAGAANEALSRVLSAAAGKGLIMVAAAGNDRRAYAAYPAGAPEVIAVTAVDARGKLYAKANTGSHIEFAAPGVDVWSISGDGGTYRSGTSFAAPVVTGLIARLAARGRVSTGAARAALQRGAVDLGAGGRDAKFGWGLVQSPPC